MAKYDKVGRVSTASVFKGSGRHWGEWIQLLDKASARDWPHAELVAYLERKYKLTPWWRQAVAYGYQVAIGRRLDGQNAKGLYAVTVTGTFALSSASLWKAMMSPDGLDVWLKPLAPFTIEKGREFECEGGVFGSVRTFKANARLRLAWSEVEWDKPTILNVLIVKRPGSKCLLGLTHEQLTNVRQREEMRAFWKTRLTELKAALSAGAPTKRSK